MNAVDVVLASELMPGTYLCLETRTLLGWLVRLFTRSPFDHAALVVGPGEIIQATTKGVSRGPLSQFRGCLAVANSADRVWSSDRELIVAKALTYSGYEYAFPAIVVIGLRKLGFKWRWLLRASASADRDAVFCSELIALAGQAGHHDDWLCGEKSAATVTPAELAGRAPYMRSVVWDG